MLAALLLAASQPSAVHMPPVELCESDPAFVAFRREWASVVRRKDASALRELTDPEIMINLGGGRGWNLFARQWKPSRPGSRLWAELEEVLSLGCQHAVGDRRQMPAFDGEDADGLDPYGMVIAIRPGAMLRFRPDTTASAVMELRYHRLTATGLDAPRGWLAVKTASGRHGYVQLEDVRSLIDYRALFGKKNGRWRLVAFLAGD